MWGEWVNQYRRPWRAAKPTACQEEQPLQQTGVSYIRMRPRLRTSVTRLNALSALSNTGLLETHSEYAARREKGTRIWKRPFPGQPMRFSSITGNAVALVPGFMCRRKFSTKWWMASRTKQKASRLQRVSIRNLPKTLGGIAVMFVLFSIEKVYCPKFRSSIHANFWSAPAAEKQCGLDFR